MKGNAAIIRQLNAVLKNELVSINQTFLHARMFDNWGMKRIGKREYKKSILDMKQADKLIERVLFLEGMPNLQAIGRLRIGENTEEILQCELTLEDDCVAELRQGIALCESERDFVTRSLLVDILNGEEEFVDWLETQTGLIRETGLENYIQSQI